MHADIFVFTPANNVLALFLFLIKLSGSKKDLADSVIQNFIPSNFYLKGNTIHIYSFFNNKIMCFGDT